jgi:hypothetical protein
MERIIRYDVKKLPVFTSLYFGFGVESSPIERKAGSSPIHSMIANKKAS